MDKTGSTTTAKKRRRVKCRRKWPMNELFRYWLEEEKSKVGSIGAKSQYAFAKALKSMEKCPIELFTPHDAKALENIGDGIVKLLDDKLRDFTTCFGPPTFQNIQMVGVLVSDDDQNDGADDDAVVPKKTKRKSTPREYVPGYRTGGYAIIRALYDATEEEERKGSNTIPNMQKEELQAAAQAYCDEPMVPSAKVNPYSAWNGINTLLRHQLVHTSRVKGQTMQYCLTPAGIEMGKRLANGGSAAIPLGAPSPSPQSSPSPPPPPPARRTKTTALIRKKATPSPKAASSPVGNKSPTKSTSLWKDVVSTNSPSKRGFNDYDDYRHRPPSPDISYDYPQYPPSPPRYDYQPPYDEDVYGGPSNFDYGGNIDHESKPLSERIVGRSSGAMSMADVLLGYIYLDPNGRSTRDKDQAYMHIDEVESSVWYLVETTAAYMENIGREKFKKPLDLPLEMKEKSIVEEGRVWMYLRSASADDFAPGILETMDYLKPNFGIIKTSTEPKLIPKSGAGDLPFVSTISAARSMAIGKPNLWDDEPKSATSVTRSANTASNSHSSNGAAATTTTAPSMPSLSMYSGAYSNGAPSSTSYGASTSAVSLSREKSSTSLPRPISLNTPDEMIVLEPGEFEIILLVDHGETAGGNAMFGQSRKNRKALLTEGLTEQNVMYAKTRLPVGDYLFVAKPKSSAPSGSRSFDGDGVLVLGPIIERKRMDDLAGSIKDGRFHEQKQRLHACGVHKVIYLIEEFGRMDTHGVKEQALRSAIVGTQICNEFDVICKSDSHGVIKYLKHLLDHQRTKFSGKRLYSRQADSRPVRELIGLGAYELPLPTYREYCEASMKRRTLTVGEAFARMLMQVHGISPDSAEAIRKVYPTVSHLLDAYQVFDGDEKRENELLQSITYGTTGRKLGAEISKRIARVFCVLAPFMK